MDERVRAVMEATPRADFLRPADRERAGVDSPVSIGAGQTSSQPRTVRDMLQLLDVAEGDHVLDVGCGSGWTTAILARLTGPRGDVIGVERVPDLVDFGRANLTHAGLPNAVIRPSREGHLGAPDDAPFDRVLVSAEPAELPPSLVEQLAPGAVMVIPVAGHMLRVQARGAGEQPTVTEHGRYRFVPLITDG